MMQILYPDLINGGFEALAGFFVLNHCRVLYAQKAVRGVSAISTSYFTLWGIWNLYYYPALNQPISFFGGLFVVTANILHVAMMLYYRAQESSNNKVYIGNSK